MKTSLANRIDACLPQTQCTLCGYPNCISYAKAIAEKAEENLGLCVPGEEKALAKITTVLASPLDQWLLQVKEQTKTPVMAKINHDECIGCTKCIDACPVDAIIGSSKKLHAIIESECTGCELCLDPCPVDCIILIHDQRNDTKLLYDNSNSRRLRYLAKQARIKKLKLQSKKAHSLAKAGFNSKKPLIQARQELIQEALKRNKRDEK